MVLQFTHRGKTGGMPGHQSTSWHTHTHTIGPHTSGSGLWGKLKCLEEKPTHTLGEHASAKHQLGVKLGTSLLLGDSANHYVANYVANPPKNTNKMKLSYLKKQDKH